MRGMHQYHLGKVWRSSFVTRYRFARRADVSLGCTQYERAPEMKMVIFFRPTSSLELWRNQNSATKLSLPFDVAKPHKRLLVLRARSIWQHITLHLPSFCPAIASVLRTLLSNIEHPDTPLFTIEHFTCLSSSSIHPLHNLSQCPSLHHHGYLPSQRSPVTSRWSSSCSMRTTADTL